MMRGSARRTQGARRELVIALHCSGAGAAQWRRLAEALGENYELVAPEHYGGDSTGPWPGEHAFTLADEAARTIALIDGTDRQVHLVGHSYGGGVALHAALARPDRIASLTLYEPSAFHLLWQLDHAAAALTEIKAIAYAVATGVVTGDYRNAAATFVDYWGGPGAWAAMRPSAQDALVRWMPMAPPEFSALFKEPTLACDYARLALSDPGHPRRARAGADAAHCRGVALAVALHAARGRGGCEPHGPADPCGRGQRADRSAHRAGSRARPASPPEHEQPACFGSQAAKQQPLSSALGNRGRPQWLESSRFFTAPPPTSCFSAPFSTPSASSPACRCPRPSTWVPSFRSPKRSSSICC